MHIQYCDVIIHSDIEQPQWTIEDNTLVLDFDNITIKSKLPRQLWAILQNDISPGYEQMSVVAEHFGLPYTRPVRKVTYSEVKEALGGCDFEFV